MRSLNSELKLGKLLSSFRKECQNSVFLNSLAASGIEETIVKHNFEGSEDHLVNFDEFLQRLQIPASDTSFTLFSFFVKDNEDVIDFKEYLLHALYLIKLKDAKIELVKVLFMVSLKFHFDFLN